MGDIEIWKNIFVISSWIVVVVGGCYGVEVFKKWLGEKFWSKLVK